MTTDPVAMITLVADALGELRSDVELTGREPQRRPNRSTGRRWRLGFL